MFVSVLGAEFFRKRTSCNTSRMSSVVALGYLACFLLIMFLVSGCNTKYGDSKTNSVIPEQSSLFALSFICEGKTKHCVIDRYPPGRDITLIAGEGSKFCRATTAEAIPFFHPFRTYDVTQLNLASDCQGEFHLGIFGVAPEAIRISKVRTVPVSDYREMDNKARSAIKYSALSKEDPTILVADFAKVMAYKVSGEPYGPSAVLVGGNSYLLDGWCTTEHTFFSIGGKNYLWYLEVGCSTGIYVGNVYEFSDKDVRKIYRESRFGT